MSKKNSSVNLKNNFKNFEDLSRVFSNFKNRLDKTNKKTFLVAVSGGPDSLALVALSKAYSFERSSDSLKPFLRITFEFFLLILSFL